MRRLFLVLLVLVFLGFSGLGIWYVSYLRTPSTGEGEEIVRIARGMGVRQIGALLAQKGLIQNDIRYLAYVYLGDLTTRLRAGEYSIARGLTPPEVIRLLVEGATLRHQVTIPEGLSAVQVAELFARDGWIDPDRFLALTRKREFIHSLGLEVESLEGYLFPETYTMVRNEVSEQRVLEMMVQRFFQVWSALHVPEKGVHGLSRHQVVILASIVEKETGAASERPLIARVFLNRLEKKMRLQSDPTVIYGIKDFNGNITRADLRTKTPYNTYVIAGLPAGPICNPGRAALEAIIIPAASEALYFVSRNDGTHIFSTNLRDHNRAVWKFQRKK
ncbi:endolytic transglycosylase MltG [Desulfobulbus rhabdoformis]|uniref:endolytic transglycosylase MltG n=1 Tax=Desulfobulbus rhabdoformis TaxID=34032 RepID=UPI001963D0DD|nr:endolytic transglycosylase MltG [Desulfobulbus rhabdoformis]MBM9615784.1 endolytic transglycosylase MltG [Desulfobulbus rhabdoformis]